MRTATLFAILTLAVCNSAGAQSSRPVRPVKGIVWTPPTQFTEVRADLEQIAAHGAEAVRLPLVLDSNFHAVADLYGLTLYQEVDARFLPSARLVERKDEILVRLDSALNVAATAPGHHVFGLGYWNDTSEAASCQVIKDLSDHVRNRLPGAKTYYVSAFVASDVCSSAVDFVLLDAKGTVGGLETVREWRRRSDTPVGLAAVGFPVQDESQHGYTSRFSPDHQARMLESELRSMLAEANLYAVFVDGWRNRGDASGGLGDFGLLKSDGSPRPAAGVVAGLFTGSQRVFAFDAGSTSGNDFSWINLISFLSVALFGLTYYGSIGLRSVVRRYFLSHSIYLEKLGDGRETAIGTSMFLLIFLSIAASLVGMTVVTDLSGTRLWYPLLDWMPEWIATAIQVGIARSGWLVPIFAGMFALVTLLWAAGLSLSTRAAKPIRFGQALLIAVMPRWPVALIGLLALVMLNWQIDAPGFVLIAVMAFWFVVVITYTGRMLSDFLRLLGIGALWTIPVLLLALVLLAGVVWLVVVTNDLRPELGYFWNIASRA